MINVSKAFRMYFQIGLKFYQYNPRRPRFVTVAMKFEKFTKLASKFFFPTSMFEYFSVKLANPTEFKNESSKVIECNISQM